MLHRPQLLCIALFFSAPFFALAAKTPPLRADLTADAARRDFKIMNAIFARSHATAFKQIPAREAPDIFKDLETVSLGEFIGRILGYYGRIHVDHTMIGFSPELIEAHGLKARFFPLPLRFFGARAYLDTRYKNLPLGVEVTHINGKAMSDIVAGFTGFPRAASGVSDWDSYYLGEQFASWYFLTGNTAAPWKIGYLGPTSESTEFFSVDPPADGVPLKRASTDRDYFKPVLHSMFLDEKKIAYFAINSFMPAGSPYNTLESWMQYFGQFNTESRRRGAKTLILDLRENRGGVMHLAAASAGWFTHTPITDLSESSVHTRLLPYREFAIAINGQRAKPADFDKLEKYLQTEFADTIQDGYFATRNADARHVRILPLNDAYRFDKIYILVSHTTYSAAVYFARLLKLAHPNVVLTGAETGSAGDGHSAETLVTYRLPESGILFDVPLARVRFAPLLPGQIPGKGLKADLPLADTLGDFRGRRDAVLEEVVRAVMPAAGEK